MISGEGNPGAIILFPRQEHRGSERTDKKRQMIERAISFVPGTKLIANIILYLLLLKIFIK
ncbi:MAG: hypothetical protein CVV52_06345 [Spirochaetae bacterium HGW-Spirochaetae-8]|jgi:hypothetical protein|nr:MAG: hypothetical protein CVV52_06345 [Spirochaetae bacterium HGW-Spirochaetae-8]